MSWKDSPSARAVSRESASEPLCVFPRKLISEPYAKVTYHAAEAGGSGMITAVQPGPAAPRPKLLQTTRNTAWSMKRSSIHATVRPRAVLRSPRKIEFMRVARTLQKQAYMVTGTWLAQRSFTPRVATPFASRRQVPTFHAKARAEPRRLHAGCRPGSNQARAQNSSQVNGFPPVSTSSIRFRHVISGFAFARLEKKLASFMLLLA